MTEQKIRDLVNDELEVAFNDSEAVSLLKEFIDEETSNAETIGILIDRIEELEEKVNSLITQEV